MAMCGLHTHATHTSMYVCDFVYECSSMPPTQEVVNSVQSALACSMLCSEIACCQMPCHCWLGILWTPQSPFTLH
jgi:hypothetical protein